MTSWRNLRGSNFISPEDVEKGPIFCTIKDVRSEQLTNDEGNPKKEALVIVEGKQRHRETGEVKPFAKTEWVANVVNLTLLEALFGTEHYEQWIGKRMLLHYEPCEVPGRFFDTPSVRVAGGPDITTEIPVEVVLKMKGGKKRKPIHKVLRPTKRQDAAGAAVASDAGSQ